MEFKKEKQRTWRDQKLGTCPHAPKPSVVAPTQQPSNTCTGPGCQLWVRESAHPDAPGNCATTFNAIATTQVMQAVQAQTDALTEAAGRTMEMVEMGLRLKHAIGKMLAKASPALKEEYEQILKEEAEARAEEKTEEAKESIPPKVVN